jgi:hypothetical protein
MGLPIKPIPMKPRLGFLWSIIIFTWVWLPKIIDSEALIELAAHGLRTIYIPPLISTRVICGHGAFTGK